MIRTANYLCCMSEDLNIIAGTKAEQYESLIPQIKGLLDGEPDIVANLANVVAALKEQFDWLWIGFYLVKPAFAKASDSARASSDKSTDKPAFAEASADKKELVLGPFQGPVACTRIRKGKGVCGTSWEKAQTIIVPDVEKFPGHIACSSLSRSEIVVPVIRNNEVIAVLDVDSKELDRFDETDRFYLEKILELIKF
jgi:L-methionine (R)-S-oxide reductase